MSKSALVVGGTGPTGPDIVNGLLDRGFEVSIFHGGFHEVEFAGDVIHIHGDPHFPETIQDALGNSSYEIVIAQYGRLRHLIDHFKGRTTHFVGIGGSTGQVAAREASEWGPIGRPSILAEDQVILETDEERNKFGYRMAEAWRHLFRANEEGAFRATYIGYPILYGPRQPGSREWAIVRRLLDDRQRIILPDGGLKLESRGYVRNVSLAPLLAIDQPDSSEGQSYTVADREIHSVRQRVEAIARFMGKKVEIIDIPFRFAKPAYPLYRNSQEHRVGLSQRIRAELGYTDTHSAAEGLERTVEWLLQNPPERGGEVEQQLGDPFDYTGEDRIIEAWESVAERMDDIDFDVPEYAHIYRHPKRPNEAWTRPESPVRPD